MIVPPLLTPGDKVAIVAPAKKLSLAEINAAAVVVESWGLRVVTGPHVYTNDHDYLSASDTRRQMDLQAVIDDTDVRAIFCARGGYGCTRIIDSIDLTSLRSSPKWIIGFSDITALLLAAYNFGVMSIHGTMPVQFAKENWTESTENLRRALFNGMQEITARASDANRLGSASGTLIGGNLSILADSLGTCSEVNTQGCILMLEEIDEDYYRLDRMLTHLKRMGKFHGLAGLAIGHLTDLKDTSDFKEGFERMLIDKVRDTTYPIAWGMPFGHENPNAAWVLGQYAELQVHAGGSILTPR